MEKMKLEIGASENEKLMELMKAIDEERKEKEQLKSQQEILSKLKQDLHQQMTKALEQAHQEKTDLQTQLEA